MEIKRGPRGYKMVHADVGVCDTIVGINPRGFFTFRNQLSNGFTFECQSLINSKVSITSIYSDGDVEHHSSELMQQVTQQWPSFELWSAEVFFDIIIYLGRYNANKANETQE